jgi:hypothetical protein
MSEQADKPLAPPYEDVSSAPVVYFDIVACNGICSGAVQIELAQRILVPVMGTNEVLVKFATSGRIRCSPTAARFLIAALEGTLKMLEQPQEQAASASKLN